MQRLPRSWASAPRLGARTRTCTFDVREAQAAVNAMAMQTWMQHPLAKQQPVLVEVPAEEGGGDVCL